MFAHEPVIQVPGQSFDETDMVLGKAMRAAWVQFAKTGNPNGPGLAVWPRYEAQNEQCLEFADTVSAVQLPGISRIDMLYSIFKELRSARQKVQMSRKGN